MRKHDSSVHSSSELLSCSVQFVNTEHQFLNMEESTAPDGDCFCLRKQVINGGASYQPNSHCSTIKAIFGNGGVRRPLTVIVSVYGGKSSMAAPHTNQIPVALPSKLFSVAAPHSTFTHYRNNQPYTYSYSVF